VATPRFQSVDDYLASLDPVKAATLRAVLEGLLEDFPELQAKLAWNVPMLHRDGKYVAGVSAFAKHLTFAPWSQHVIAAFKPRLAKYVVRQNLFQVPVDWKPDRPLLKAMVKARLAELDAE
jgi:uncharacterized protein YdhG (YjbR/CyaY superfamily)